MLSLAKRLNNVTEIYAINQIKMNDKYFWNANFISRE